MRFFRNNYYWILGIVIGLVIGSIIVVHRGKQQISETEHISPDDADRSSDEIKPLGASSDGYWHNGKWHAASHNDDSLTSAGKTSATKFKRSPHSIGTPTLKLWRHHPHTSDYRRGPKLNELGLPQEKLDRILQEANMTIIPEGGIDDPVAWVEEMIQKRVDILTEGLNTVGAFKLLKIISFPGGQYEKHAREYAQRAISENPDFLEGRLYLVYRGPDDARSAAEFREILRDFPDSIGALTGLGNRLIMDHPVEAIYHLKRANRMDSSAGLAALGHAYQRLGDYKTGWTYLKKAQTYPHGPSTDRHVEMIEAGTPLIQPLLPLMKPEQPDDTGKLSEGKDAFPKGSATGTETFRDDIRLSDESSPGFSSDQKAVDSGIERAAAIAKQAREEFLKHQELSEKELDDFLQWAKTIINTESPMDTNNFLIKEMETFLKGGQSHFEPDQIVRAFEIMERYGTKEGIKHLEKKYPDVAKQMKRFINEERPPRQR